MELKVTQENLNKALSLVARVAGSRSTLPVLSNVLLQVVNNRLKISATNLDIAISKFVGAKIVNAGALTVPARLLQDYVANLPNTTITLKQDGNKLHVSTENYESTINGMDAGEYPVMPDIKNGKKWSIPSADLKQALQQVIIAVSHDEARPILTGVFLQSDNSYIKLAATDSYRLAEKKLSHKGVIDPVIIPASAAQEILRTISDASDEDVKTTHDAQQAKFEVEDTELIARLVEGNYPEYTKLIPESFAVHIKINKQELINITKVSSLFARESAGSVVLRTNKANNTLTIQSVASQVGENEASAAAEVSADGEITLNARFLLEGLQAIQGDTVSLNFNGKLEPFVITDTDNDDYLHIVMPLKS